MADGRARRDARDDHSFDQAVRIAFHHEAIGEGAGVAFVRIADDVFLRGRGLAHGPPFDARRECGAAAPAQARFDERLACGGAVECERIPQAFEAAVRDVIVDRQRIGDADAREREPLLALQIGNLVDDADARRMRGAVEPARVEERGDVGCREVRIADAARRGAHFDERLEPQQPARAVAHELDRDAARGRLRLDRARERVGADRERGRIARHMNARAHAGSFVRTAASKSASKRAGDIFACGSSLIVSDGDCAQRPRQ